MPCATFLLWRHPVTSLACQNHQAVVITFSLFVKRLRLWRRELYFETVLSLPFVCHSEPLLSIMRRRSGKLKSNISEVVFSAYFSFLWKENRLIWVSVCPHPISTFETVDRFSWNLVWTLCNTRPPKPVLFNFLQHGRPASLLGGSDTSATYYNIVL